MGRYEVGRSLRTYIVGLGMVFSADSVLCYAMLVGRRA